jgi:hypothetical protein
MALPSWFLIATMKRLNSQRVSNGRHSLRDDKEESTSDAPRRSDDYFMGVDPRMIRITALVE